MAIEAATRLPQKRAHPRSIYRQFYPGQTLEFALHTLAPNGSVVSRPEVAEVEAVRGGGFFGQVLILKDQNYVLKTSVPDPWHDLWRRINWGFRDFPSQVNVYQAQRNYLTLNLIRDVLPPLTDGQFISPGSPGYTRLANGFALEVDKMQGRGPRYDLPENEFESFREAQRRLQKLGYELGLEQAAQIHPDNPYGLANLWRNSDTEQLIWLDALPAIPHKGWIWPSFYFRFHKDVREWFYPKDPHHITFDKIHPERFLDTVRRARRKFPDDVYHRVLENLALYQSLSSNTTSPVNSRRNLRAATIAVAEVAQSIHPKVVKKAGAVAVASVKAIVSSSFRQEAIKKLALHGAEEAYKKNVITLEEWLGAKASVDAGENRRRTLPTLATILLYHQLSGLALKSPEIASYAYVFGSEAAQKLVRLDLTPLYGPDFLSKLPWFGAICLGFRAAGSLNRFAATWLIGKGTKVDLNTAAKISLVPVIGGYLATPAQAAVSVGNRSELIWHYAVRDAVARISALSPSGGWGTELEGKLWYLLGERLEKLATFEKQK